MYMYMVPPPTTAMTSAAPAADVASTRAVRHESDESYTYHQHNKRTHTHTYTHTHTHTHTYTHTHTQVV